ncbi:nitroreductase family protein [Micromonospora sp. STR1s_5]|nr:nitroreductase family protein [Micromonospora sp. STR1s_5]
MIVTSGAETDRFRLALQEHIGSGAAPASDIDWPTYQGPYLERRREVGWMLYGAVGVKRGDREGTSRQASENFRLFGAPHLAVITSDRALGTYGVLDCGIFIQSFLLAAAARGIATIPQAAIAGHSPFLRSHFGLRKDRLIVCGISFGLADRAHAANRFRAPRVNLAETVDWWGDPEL